MSSSGFLFVAKDDPPKIEEAVNGFGSQGGGRHFPKFLEDRSNNSSASFIAETMDDSVICVPGRRAFGAAEDLIENDAVRWVVADVWIDAVQKQAAKVAVGADIHGMAFQDMKGIRTEDVHQVAELLLARIQDVHAELLRSKRCADLSVQATDGLPSFNERDVYAAFAHCGGSYQAAH